MFNWVTNSSNIKDLLIIRGHIHFIRCPTCINPCNEIPDFKPFITICVKIGPGTPSVIPVPDICSRTERGVIARYRWSAIQHVIAEPMDLWFVADKVRQLDWHIDYWNDVYHFSGRIDNFINQLPNLHPSYVKHIFYIIHDTKAPYSHTSQALIYNPQVHPQLSPFVVSVYHLR